MRLHRFYIPEKVEVGKELRVDSPEFANQIRNVFRLKTGDGLVVFDGSGYDYRCSVSYPSEGDQKVVVLTTLEKVMSPYMPPREITLYSALVKKDTFEWIVEKATELGVIKIVPVLAERSEKKALNIDRLNKIAIEASEQSGRGNVPVIGNVIELEAAVHGIGRGMNGGTGGDMGREGYNIFVITFHTEGAAFDKKIVSQNGPLAVFIGPEGGWSPAEIELFHKEKIPVVCLGPQVLRAETAVVSALSMMVFG